MKPLWLASVFALSALTSIAGHAEAGRPCITSLEAQPTSAPRADAPQKPTTAPKKPCPVAIAWTPDAQRRASRVRPHEAAVARGTTTTDDRV